MYDETDSCLMEAEQFFAPVSADLVDGLMGQYRAVRKRLEAMAVAVNSDACTGVLHYFIKANTPEQKYSTPTLVEELFSLEGAIAELDADFWNRALRMTDVLDCMPQKRRQEWFDQIQHPMGRKRSHGGNDPAIEPIPAFEEDTVRTTLEHLLMSRAKFFGERVDGIFQRLSRDHVTNCPQGFSKRMILQRAINSYGHTDHDTAGYINDLRCIVAKFMGRDEPKYGATDGAIQTCRHRTGQWVTLDGGAIRMRVYRGVGTGHLEVHPDMAWRLNAVLASMYPMAIPAEFRERPKKARKVKDIKLFGKPLPFVVVEALDRMKPGYRRADDDRRGNTRFVNIPNTLRFDFGVDDAVLKQAEAVLAAIGGTRAKEANAEHWAFDYEVGPVISDIVCSGMIPDQQAHQFYPTPERLARIAVELASEGAEPTMTWLEPSAGTGGLADLMPKGRTKCVEVSELHCTILRAKGHDVVCADFLGAPEHSGFDRVVMNPPFSGGRWQSHLGQAWAMLRPGGRLVAILPASAKGKNLLDGAATTWGPVFDNEFAGTSVSVVIGVFDSPIKS